MLSTIWMCFGREVQYQPGYAVISFLVVSPLFSILTLGMVLKGRSRCRHPIW